MIRLLQFFGHRWPFERGRQRLFNFLFRDTKRRNWITRLQNPVLMRRGFRLATHSDEYTSLWFRLYGCYERNSILFMAEELRHGGVFLDIGANLGLFSIDLAMHTPCDVIAFEPNESTARLLHESIRLNKLENRIQVRRCAVSNTSGQLEFFDNPDNAGDSALVTASTPAQAANRHLVPVVSLDEDRDFQGMLPEGAVIRAVKMDIQGAEVDAIEGMRETLARHKPVLLIEIAEECLLKFSKTAGDLYAALAKEGYEREREIDGNAVFRHKSKPAPPRKAA